MSLNCELRHLEYSHVDQLGKILSVNQSWKDVMGAIPKKEIFTSAIDCKDKRFTKADVDLVMEESLNTSKSAFEILVQEWGTMGRKRPDLGTLLVICLEVDAIQAGSYIYSNILNNQIITSNDQKRQVLQELYQQRSQLVENPTPPPPAPPTEAISDELGDDLSDDDNSDIFTYPGPHNGGLLVPSISFNYLRKITADFAAMDSSRMIGSGGFADVFRGVTLRSGRELAVKRLKQDFQQNVQQFNYEVDEFSRLDHRFIIKILGYSNDSQGGACLLVYPYYKNGTLEQMLQGPKAGTLDVDKRIKIAKGVAEGLNYLHSKKPKALIHRDIKSSNILLDEDLLPKIADFGLLRFASTNNTTTSNIKGTPYTMAPEALRGSISTAVDVYSFGVLMLEIITGLRGMLEKDDCTREDLVSHVNNMTELLGFEEATEELLDDKVTWPESLGLLLFQLAQSCLATAPTKRPDMASIVRSLSTWDS